MALIVFVSVQHIVPVGPKVEENKTNPCLKPKLTLQMCRQLIELKGQLKRDQTHSYSDWFCYPLNPQL